MDSLGKLLRAQRSLMKRYYSYPLSGRKREKEIKEACLALIVEAVEILSEINWKPWKRKRKKINEGALKEEIIDALHFLLEIMVLLKMNSKEVMKQYLGKREVNLKRIKGGE